MENDGDVGAHYSERSNGVFTDQSMFIIISIKYLVNT